MDHFSSPIDALAWYLDSGVDEPVGDLPVDRFQAPRPAAEAPPPRPAAPPRPATVPLPGLTSDSAGAVAQAAETSRAIAAACADVPALEAAIRAFEGCTLRPGARSTVIADGVPGAPLMLIGEAPGREEDEQGLPFVGRAGQLLDRMLKAIGHDRKVDAYIANAVFWRPPGNRKPTPVETAACRPFVERLIELCRPRVLVLLGSTPAATLLDTTTGITRLRGAWKEISGIPVMPTFHPAYLLRNPAAKADSWRDFLAVKLRLEGGQAGWG